MNHKIGQINYLCDEEEYTYAKLDTKEEVRLPYYSYRMIKLYCLRYACPIQARLQYAKHVLKASKKIPILVRDKDHMIFFPIYGHPKKDIWINYEKIDKIKENKFGSEIHFQNKEVLYLDIHITTLRKQLRRCKTILSYMNENIV